MLTPDDAPATPPPRARFPRHMPRWRLPVLPDLPSLPAWSPFALIAGLVVVAFALSLASAAAGPPAPAATSSTRAPRPVHLALDIFPVRPLGPTANWPAYTPATTLSVPADSLVTLTIRNFDLGSAPLPANSPYAHVTGTTSGIAQADGQSYTAIAPDQVAHTFTISQLHVNVPIPGTAQPGQSFVTVTFSFRTGTAAGSYSWRCNAPCGTDGGYGGPMQTPGYMLGTLMAHGCCCSSGC